MEYAHFAKQNYGYAATFPLRDFCPKFAEQGFDVAPLHVGARRVGEQQFERALVLPLHRRRWYQKSVPGATAREVEDSDG